ncbi:hypothetical protein ACET3X_005342 [Alternaria dauci]|uniref:Uncharacterized protein n=1 Tax=Alternaria dauci TaxID=48095 RepID=A0ABR3UKM4_9PLEO
MTTTFDSNDAANRGEIAPQADEEQDYVSRVGWKALFSFTTRKHVPVLVGGIFMASLAALTMPVFAILYGLVSGQYTSYGKGDIDSNQFIGNIAQLCIILAGIGTLNWIANSLYFTFLLVFGELQARSARDRVFDSLLKKDMAWFDMRESGVAAFLPAVQMHIRDLQLAVSSPFGEAVHSLVQGLASLGVAFYYSWNLSLVILCTIPVLYLVQSLVASRLSLRAQDHADKLQSGLKYVTTALTNIETVKCFNGERYELHVFSNIVSLAANLYRWVANLRSIQIGIMQFFTLSIFVQGFWYGSHLVDIGYSTAGEVFTTFWAVLMAMSGMTQIMPQLIVLSKGKMAGAKLSWLTKQMSAIDQQVESQGQTRPARCPGDIEFRKVTFSYPTRRNEMAICDVSLFIPAGETTFFVGKSGSGKTTLSQLLIRFYRPSSGQILLDKVPLEELDVQWLRRNVMLVEQHSVLFNNTVRHNLALGNMSGTVDMQEIHDVIKFSRLEPVMNGLPDGLDTNLGMHGDSLSGGQKQRMALARAKIRNSPVLILDESTSALDYVTRAEILDAIRNWRKGKTTIIITHDISQIRSDNFVYLLENGRIVQEGYRKELGSQAGAFQAFLDTHKEVDEINEDDQQGIDGKSCIENETDGTTLLHDKPRMTRVISTQRPLSTVLFGQRVLAPFLGRARASWAGTENGDLDTYSRQSVHATEGDRGRHSELTLTPEPLESNEAYPDMIELKELESPDKSRFTGETFFSKDYGSRPCSPACGARSRSNSQVRPMSLSKDFGSRPVSRLSTRPVSRIDPHSQPPVAREPVPIHLETSKKRPKNGKFLSKIDLQKEEGDTSAASLPMKDIFTSILPTIGWSSRLLFFGATLSATIHSACTPIFAWAFAMLLSTFYDASADDRQARNYALAILGVAAVDGLSSYFMFFLSDTVAQTWTLLLKKEAMRRILLQPREFFDEEENSISRITETLDHFAEEARNLPGRFACIFLVVFLMTIIGIIWSMVIAWQLALVALATGPVLFAITQCYNMISSRWERLANEADDKVGQVLHETFINIRTVRCLALEDHFRRKYNNATTEAVNVGIKRAIYSGSVYGLSYSGIIFVAILLFWYGGLLISWNRYSVTEVNECFLVLMLSVNHVSYMSNYITQINMSRDAGSRLLRLARLPTDSHELTGTTQIQSACDISLDKVSFRYPARKDVEVLNDVSFNISQGSCTAIVGSSGSGKSTIASLILKMYQTDGKSTPSSGSAGGLSISNHDVKDLHTITLRSRMALVSQAPVLFPGTIAENIAYGLSPSHPNGHIDSIRAAARAAGISEFIDSLSQGYNTLIGEGGTRLSSGQAQRLSIARALVRNPDVLILDEVTSALDVASVNTIRNTILRLVSDDDETPSPIAAPLSPHAGSGEIWDGVDEDWDIKVAKHQERMAARSSEKGKEPRKRMTVIIITHAREMMAIAGHVVMMEKGRVIEQGTFKELKKKGTAFERLLRGVRE